MPDLASEQFVSLTTFTRDGRPKPLPVWIVGAGGGRLGFTTSTGSWKVKRLTNDPRVELRPSDRSGRVEPDAPIVTGTAEVVTGPEFERIKNLVQSKYGVMWTVIAVIGKVRSLFGSSTTSDCAVLITPDATD
ncbi:MAG: PPOX class F420-dependent oxidoreductase [Actinomycetota bacterium]